MKKQSKKPVKKTTRRKLKLLAKTYRQARFLPAVAISLFASYLWVQPNAGVNITRPIREGVLAKATNMSVGGLLSATNAQRSSYGVGSLAINGKLNAAAQAKAVDMVTKGYWSHVSPDGKQPWWFITNAGYSYTSAGENLAYGFMSSSSAVTGWMNSPSHKTNMLNGIFTEVGFGIADTDNYTYGGSSYGPQTIVVAMYAKPQVAAASVPATQQSTPAAKPAAKPAAVAAAQPAAEEPQPEKTEETPAEEPEKEEELAVLDTDKVIVAAPAKVSRIQILTGGNAVWSATFVVLAVCAVAGLWLLHKGIRIKKLITAGENFITHHVHLDLTVLAIIFLGIVLLSTSGAIL